LIWFSGGDGSIRFARKGSLDPSECLSTLGFGFQTHLGTDVKLQIYTLKNPYITAMFTITGLLIPVRRGTEFICLPTAGRYDRARLGAGPTSAERALLSVMVCYGAPSTQRGHTTASFIADTT
jgi:hypothetical protein